MKMSRKALSILFLPLFLCTLAVRAEKDPSPRLPALNAPPIGATTYQAQILALDGRALSLADFKGKVLFLHYWNTYCGYCIGELPSIQKLWTRMRGRDDVAFLIVKKRKDVDPKDLEKALKTGSYDFPIYTEKDKATEFPNAETPVTYIVDRKGNIRFKESEAADWDDPAVDAYLDGLTKE
jgi:thiol-disulfide isomerase/thioredoxin